MLLKNCKILKNSKFEKVDILIKDDKIEKISENMDIADENTIDVKNRFVTAGFIDAHVHWREPGFSKKETVYTASRAAARGGFTTVMTMPNLNPVPDSVETLNKQLELIINYCVNFYLGTRIPEFQTLFFVVEKLYLDNEVIKIGEDVRKVFTKVKRYTKNNYKIFNYEYNIGEYSGSYDFNNLDLTIYFEKYGKKRIVDGIHVSLPYEDTPNISNVGEILKLDILKNILREKSY